MSFECPNCHTRMKCLDSRDAGASHGQATRRRYGCKCGQRISTIEMQVPSEGVGRTLPYLIGGDQLAEISAAVKLLSSLLD